MELINGIIGLSASGGEALSTEDPEGKSAVLFVCEQASKHIPASLDDLIATDTGQKKIADELAPMITQALGALQIPAQTTEATYA